jgi:vancomycin resistance protein YoaR
MRSATFPTRRIPAPTGTSLLEQALLTLLCGLVFFFFGLAGFVLGFQLWFAGRIFPGVAVSGVDVGGLTQTAAAAKILQQITYPQDGTIVLQEKETRLVTPAQMGLFLDPDSSARAAYQVGRRGGPANGLSEQFEAWFSGYDVPPSLIFDQRMAFTYLTDLAKQIDQPTIEASVGLKGTDVVVQSGVTGHTLDVSSTLTLLSIQVQSLRNGVVPLVVRENPPVIVDVSQQADLARSILSAPLKLTLPSGQPDQAGPWTFDPPTLAAMLAFERVDNNGTPDYQVTLKSDILRTYLKNLALKLELSPQDARFTFNDQTGQLDVIQPSVTGRTLDVEASIKAIQQSLMQGKHKVALVFNFQDPAVTDKASAKDLGITELVSSYTSYFYGSSPERVQNIKAAASRFHGLLVAPGEVFSMGQALGDISLDNGYAEALIIVGNQTIKGVGGGVCQVSTTLFRTVFFGGYPIVERHSHAYRVGYYEKEAGDRENPDLAGLDATVYFPLVDFKFKNDTPYWILMETYVNPATSSITWKFYSTSDGRTVKWDTTGPQNIVPHPDPLYKENPDLAKGVINQTDYAADGADITVNRTVTRKGEVYIQDTIQTHYLPWQAVYEYGPGTDVPTPTP